MVLRKATASLRMEFLSNFDKMFCSNGSRDAKWSNSPLNRILWRFEGVKLLSWLVVSFVGVGLKLLKKGKFSIRLIFCCIHFLFRFLVQLYYHIAKDSSEVIVFRIQISLNLKTITRELAKNLWQQYKMWYNNWTKNIRESSFKETPGLIEYFSFFVVWCQSYKWHYKYKSS